MNLENCDREELLEYLDTIKELEIQRSTLESVADDLAQYRGSLGIYKEFYEPQYEEPRSSGSGGNFIMAVVVFFIALIMGWLADGILGWLIPGVFAFFLIGGIIVAIILAVSGASGMAKEDEQARQNEADYQERYQNYLRNVRQDQVRVEQENAMIEYCADLENQIIDAHNDTVDVLEQLYAQGNIYEKYQFDLTAICMFYEYLESQRCDSLIGHEGAYNLFEHEKMMGLILFKLDEIIDRLEEIKQSQYMIYQALVDIQEQQEQLLGCVNSMVENQYKIIQNQRSQNQYLSEIEYNTSVLKYNDNIRMVYHLN